MKPIIDRRPAVVRLLATVNARHVVLACAVIASLIGAFTSLRLAAVVAATPMDQWLADLSPLVPLEDHPSARRNADIVAAFVADPVVVLRDLPGCEDMASTAASSAGSQCLAVIDAALRSAPASGELWLAKARQLLHLGEISESLFGALRRSYDTSAREGWIASSRVVLGLGIYPLLPDDLRQAVVNDLQLVLDYGFWTTVIDAYTSDPVLRQNAKSALEQLSEPRLKRFVGLAQAHISPAAATR